MVTTAGQETSPGADIRRAVELRTLNQVGTLKMLQSQWKPKWREQKQNKNAMTNVILCLCLGSEWDNYIKNCCCEENRNLPQERKPISCKENNIEIYDLPFLWPRLFYK